MWYIKCLPICLLLLVENAVPSSANLFPRAIENIHRVAVKHTKSLARDLRVAFGGVLLTQPPAVPQTRVVYCRPGTKSGTLGGGSGRNTTGTSHGTASGTRTSTSGRPTATVATSSPWKLNQSYEGTNFFDGWDFWNLPDPTHGTVNFIDQNTAQANNLVEVNSDGNAVMRVDTTATVQGNRQSIRITTQSTFTGGLVIMDSVHMPTGCGTWPAFWTNGPNWPSGGEIDIIEGVNNYTNNQATIHTNPGCTLPSSDSGFLNISGSVIGGTDCSAADTGNQGCGIRANSNNTYGVGFNGNGGGVYAMQWDTSGIAIYFFPSGTTPPDIDAGVPQPSTWGNALARWPATSCDPFKFFNTHSIIFDTTLCGDWASGVWSSSGIPGQEQSCAQRTGFSTCQAFVEASGSSFDEAYWEVKSVKVYQLQN